MARPRPGSERREVPRPVAPLAIPHSQHQCGPIGPRHGVNTMNRKISGVATVAALLGLAACGSSSTAPPPGASAGKPLVEEATTGSTFSNDFNPFDSNSTARAMNLASIVYEPLYELDALDPTPNGSHPWLATGYTFSNGGNSLAITVRQGVSSTTGRRSARVTSRRPSKPSRISRSSTGAVFPCSRLTRASVAAS